MTLAAGSLAVGRRLRAAALTELLSRRAPVRRWSLEEELFVTLRHGCQG